MVQRIETRFTRTDIHLVARVERVEYKLIYDQHNPKLPMIIPKGKQEREMPYQKNNYPTGKLVDLFA